MSEKSLILLGTLILIILSITFFYLNKENPQPQPQIIKTEETIPPEPESTIVEEPKPSGITIEELIKHNAEDNCWIIYENKVYDYSNAKFHPSMAQTFYRHCGQISGFEKSAKEKHGERSDENRVDNYGNYIGD